MKPLVLFLLVFLMISSGVEAQITLIPKAGFSWGKFTTNSYSGVCSPYTGGVTAGLGVNVPVSESGVFSLQTELNLTQKNHTWTRAYFDTVRLVRSLTYLEVPLLARIQLQNRRLKVYLYGGPGIGYALGGHFRGADRTGGSYRERIKFAPEPQTLANTGTFYMDPKRVNRWDITLQTGLGAGWAMGPGTFLIETRLGYGLSYLFPEYTEQTPYGYRFHSPRQQRSRTFTFTLGYALPLTKRK